MVIERSAEALILASAAVAAVLVWAAVGKLRLNSADRLRALDDLGGPSWLRRRWVLDAHPWVELLIALGLVASPAPYAALAAGLAVGLSVAYLGLVAAALRRGDGASCACLGGSAAAVSRRTVVRNLVLLVLAAAALVDAVAGHGFVDRLAEQGWRGAVWLVGVAVVVTLAVLVADRGRPAIRAGTDRADRGAGLGDDVEGMVRVPVPPDLVLIDEHGVPQRLGELAASAPQLLIFGSFGCSSCSVTYRDFPHFVGLLNGVGVRYVVADHRPGHQDDARPDRTRSTPEVPLWRDPGGAVARTLRADQMRPASVLVGVDGLTAGTAVGPQQVRAHVATLVAQLNQNPFS